MTQASVKCEVCVAGMIGSSRIPEGLWEMASANFDKVIEDWNERTKRHEVPHPGFANKFAYCPNCGHKIED